MCPVRLSTSEPLIAEEKQDGITKEVRQQDRKARAHLPHLQRGRTGRGLITRLVHGLNAGGVDLK